MNETHLQILNERLHKLIHLLGDASTKMDTACKKMDDIVKLLWEVNNGENRQKNNVGMDSDNNSDNNKQAG